MTERYPPNHIGGYEIACANVTEEIRRTGAQVRVLTTNFGIGRPRTDGHVSRLLHRPQDSTQLLRLAAWERQDAAAVRDAIRALRPHVIYAWSMLQTFASLHALLDGSGVPVVRNIQDTWLPCQFEHRDQLRRGWDANGASLVRRVAKRVRRNLATPFVPVLRIRNVLADVPLRHAVFASGFRQEQHRAAGFDVAGSCVIPNGVECRTFRPAEEPSPRSGLRLLIAGRLVREKGVHTAIEAVRHLVQRSVQDVTLTIAGDAAPPREYVEGLRQTAAGLGSRVRFAEHVSDSDMPALYRAHDVLVFPSIGAEGLPMSVLEAMASGLVVIGTTTGGTADILSHEINGLVFEPGNATAMADAILRIRSDRDLAERLAARGRKDVELRFGIENVAARHLQHLVRVADATR